MKTLELTITYRLELTVDDRVTPEDMKWAVYKAFDTCDGRQPFSCEMATDGVARMGENIMHAMHHGMVSRIANKYPGASTSKLNQMHDPSGRGSGWITFEDFFKNKPSMYFTQYRTCVVVRDDKTRALLFASDEVG